VRVAGAQGAARTGFASMVGEGLAQTDGGLRLVQADLQRLAAGDAPSLHQLMVRLEESRIAMQLVLQVRNRLLDAYQELSRMQV
jgi:flagellar hook-basal body complex protein FliE